MAVEPIRIELTIRSDPSRIAGVRQKVEALCVAGGMDEKSADEVGLCLNEALANVIRHAYAGAGDRPIRVRASCAEGQLELSIRDWGCGVDPAGLELPRYDPQQPGGLGLLCLKRLMDEVVYQLQRDGMLLTLRKNQR